MRPEVRHNDNINDRGVVVRFRSSLGLSKSPNNIDAHAHKSSRIHGRVRAYYLPSRK